MTTTEAAQYALVFAEVYVWFCVGECIGKGSIIGYNVWDKRNFIYFFLRNIFEIVVGNKQNI